MRTYTKLFAGLALCFILTPQLSRGQFRHEVTLSITNNPQTNAALVLNGETRGWRLTNSSTTVNVTNDIGWSRTNLLLNLTAYPLAVQANVRYGSSTSDIVIVGMTNVILTLSTVSNWCSWAYSTSLVYGASAVRTPYTVESNALRQWQMSCLATSLTAYATNIFPENTVAFSNYVSLTNVQAFSNKTISGSALQWGRATGLTNLTATNIVLSTGIVAHVGIHFATNLTGSGGWYTNLNMHVSTLTNATVHITNGYITNLIGHSMTITGAVLFNATYLTGTDGWYTNLNLQGPTLTNATVRIAGGYMSNVIGHSITVTNLSVPGTGLNSFKVGASTVAPGAYAMAIGDSISAEGTYAIAIGYGAATYTNYCIAIGSGVEAVQPGDTSIGTSSTAQGGTSTALGHAAKALHTNSTAIGQNATTTTTNQVRLGTSTEMVSVAGRLEVVGGTTNLTFRGNNNLDGDLQFVPRSETNPGNGNNNSVRLGTNVYVRVSGPTTVAAFGGFYAERDGSYHIVQLAAAITNVIVNEGSGVWAQATTAADRILTGTGGDLILTNQPAFVNLIYDGAASRWRVMHHATGFTNMIFGCTDGVGSFKLFIPPNGVLNVVTNN